MTDSQIVDLIREALFKVAPKRKAAFASITLDTRIDALQLDSIATMEMVGFIEDRQSTTFDEEQLARVQTVGDLGRIIRTHGRLNSTALRPSEERSHPRASIAPTATIHDE